jgi:hypothetical protein
MNEFKKYKRTNIAEMRPVTEMEVSQGATALTIKGISVSDADKLNKSPKLGDMIARNPMSHNDQWLVSKEYFKENFEFIDTTL